MVGNIEQDMTNKVEREVELVKFFVLIKELLGPQAALVHLGKKDCA